MAPHVTFGKPGALSWKPFNHIVQLSVAKDHSPTSTGNVLACGDALRVIGPALIRFGNYWCTHQ